MESERERARMGKNGKKQKTGRIRGCSKDSQKWKLFSNIKQKRGGREGRYWRSVYNWSKVERE